MAGKFTGLMSGLTERLRRIKPEAALVVSVRRHEAELVKLNHDQLDTGADMTGKDMGDYEPVTARLYKGRLHPIDLKKTGDFRKSMRLKATQKAIEMIATDSKTKVLIEGNPAENNRAFGEDILGLPDEDIQDGTVKAIILDTMIAETRKQVGL